jgi:hypothetical protein
MSRSHSPFTSPPRRYKPLPLLDAVRKVVAVACRDLSPDIACDEVPGVVVRAVMHRWPDVTPSEALMLVRALSGGSRALFS